MIRVTIRFDAESESDAAEALNYLADKVEEGYVEVDLRNTNVSNSSAVVEKLCEFCNGTKEVETVGGGIKSCDNCKDYDSQREGK